MSKEQIAEKLTAILAEEFEVEASVMTPDADVMQTLDIDSLDLVDMVVLIDKHMGVVLKKSDFAEIKTFDDFFTLIEQRTNA